MGARKKDQAVDAFSAPRSLLRAAQLEAKKRRMTKSGFYRYCLAKEVGFTETEAQSLAEHASIAAFTIIEAPEAPRLTSTPHDPSPEKIKDITYAKPHTKNKRNQ